MAFSPLIDTRSASLTNLIKEGELWSSIAGHWWTDKHSIKDRLIDEGVLIYCAQGLGRYKVGRTEGALRQGELLHLPPLQAHSYQCDPEGWEIHWLHYGGRQALRLCEVAGFSIEQPHFAYGVKPTLLDTFHRHLHSLGGAQQDPWLSTSLLYTLLTTLIRERQNTSSFGQKWLDLIDMECSNLDELAEKAGLSKYYFCRRFKKITGRTPWEVLCERRLERAKELLLSTKMSIKQIAHQLGFESADYFSRKFQAFSGFKPSAYRGRRAIASN